MINDGVCNAIAKALEYNPEVFNAIVLEDNQFTDARLAILINGLNNLDEIKSISIKSNELLDRTVDELIELMHRSLEELRLISIKTSPLMVTRLIDRLAEGCYLKKLTLS